MHFVRFRVCPTPGTHFTAIACSTEFVDRGVWVPIVKQFLSCALVWGRSIVFRHYCKSFAKCAGKDFRDGAVVPLE